MVVHDFLIAEAQDNIRIGLYMNYVTGTKLYDYIQCPHRVWRDVYGPQEEKIKETNPFVQMLWDNGMAHEEKVVNTLGEYLDLRPGSYEERFKKTIKALKSGVPLVYQGVLIFENLRGIPDLIKRQPDGTYLPIEIKSGLGFEGETNEDDEDGKPKKHYSVQLALYIDLLEKLGFEHKNCGQIIDGHFNKAIYNLDKPFGVRDKITQWDFYQQVKNNVSLLLDNEAQNKPAYSGKCKLCPWSNSCKKWVKENNDLTGLFNVGGKWRDIINEDLGIFKIKDIVKLDIDELLEQKKKDKNFLKNLGKTRLEDIKRRANIIINIKKPVLREKFILPDVKFELFFDIEDDPTQDFIYFHGVYERTAKSKKFLKFIAKNNTKEAEKRAWNDFWEYIRSLPKDDFAVYYYSHHEKTTYRAMQKEYPEVISENELEQFFNNPNVVDLFNIVKGKTDWPLPSYSIKELAVYLGFCWRDETPSGALSIQWFNDYLKTKDEKILTRISEYNEDDCKATMVLKDELVKLNKLF